jgi:putative membrane protein
MEDAMNGLRLNGSARVVGIIAVGLTAAGLMAAGSTASNADKAFVAKVSQGGAYEVEAGKIAAVRGTTPFIKDFGVMETHDHELVGAGLKKAAAATGVPIAPGLNAEFSARLAKLKTVPADQFDAYYLNDMKQIHNNDEGLFAKEAEEGTGPYKDFCHQTAVLVKAHLGWLNTI